MTLDWLNFGYDIAGSQVNAATSNAYQRALMGYQYDLNQRSLRESPSNARKGLESAGYNPILAVSNGSVFSGGSVGLGSVNVSDSHMGTNASQVKIARDAQRSQAELNLTQENVNNATQLLTNAKLNTEYVTQQNIESQTALNNINAQLGQKDLAWKDRLYLNQIKTNIINAQANQANSIANITNAKASMVNATQGSPWKTGVDLGKKVVKKFTGFDL